MGLSTFFKFGWGPTPSRLSNGASGLAYARSLALFGWGPTPSRLSSGARRARYARGLAVFGGGSTPSRLSNGARHARYARGLAVVLCVLLVGAGAARDLFAPTGAAGVLFFVASDCPISNGYAPEIQRICDDYRAKGVSCSLVYEDVSIDDAHVRAHRDAYRYKGVTAVIDGDRAIARRAKATITPQAVILGRGGIVKYRGRIDNQYAALGKPRRVVTTHDVRDALDAVIAGRAVAHPDTEAFGCFIAPR